MEYKEFCESLAREAGKIMKEVFTLSVDKEWKEDNTPVTVADTKINSLVIEEVKKQFPNQDIKGEEESYLDNNSEYVWVCDPVDGTIPFSHGIPTAVFSLALVKDGKPIVGVIYDPWSDRLYFAEKGKGCFLNNEKIQVNKSNDCKKSLIGVTTWRTGKYDISNIYQELNNKFLQILDLGSFIHMGALVAPGTFLAAYFPGITAHDGAAVKIIVEEAGGKVTDAFGNEQRYDQPIKGFLATNGTIHQEMLDLISKSL